MKRIIFILTLIMSCSTMFADDYLPMVREGVKWVYRLSYTVPGDNYFKVLFINYEFRDDVEINGMTYKKCWRTIEDRSGTFDTTPTVIAYAREKNKKVYAIYDDAFVAQTRSYNAGYREFSTMPFKIQGMYAQDIDVITIHQYTYKDYNDEYLIYDFNDLSDFYAKYPKVTYNLGYIPGLRYFDENGVLQELQENQGVIVTVGKQADTIGYVNVQGRELMQYKVKTTSDSQVIDRMNSVAAGQGQVSPGTEVELNDESLLAIEGYGVYNLGRSLESIPKRNIAAFYCRSFMSPEAMMRHIDESIFDNVANAVYFCFCHIEDNGEKIIQRELCDYYHDVYNNSDAQNSGIDEVVTGYIKVDDAYYDMQGRRVSEPTQPGIYIHNREKVVVK